MVHHSNVAHCDDSKLRKISLSDELFQSIAQFQTQYQYFGIRPESLLDRNAVNLFNILLDLDV